MTPERRSSGTAQDRQTHPICETVLLVRYLRREDRHGRTYSPSFARTEPRTIRRDLAANSREAQATTWVRAPRRVRGLPRLLRYRDLGVAGATRRLVQRQRRTERPRGDQAGGCPDPRHPAAVGGRGDLIQL